MKATLSCAYVGGLLKSIHQPLPLSQREQDRLLKTLTSSFRKHLDAEHGPGADYAASPTSSPLIHHQGAAAEANSDNSNPHAAQRPLCSRPTGTPTNLHLQSMLSNPLFRKLPVPTAAAAAGAQRSGSGTGLFLGQRDPMEVFERAVAAGLMTLGSAAGCLKAKRHELVASPAASINSAMARCGAGTAVLDWLRSTGQERSVLRFAPANNTLRKELLFFLSAEGRDHVIWSWFRALVAFAKLPEEEAADRRISAQRLLLEFADCKASGEESLVPAYKCVEQGRDLALKATLGNTSRAADSLLYAWRHVCWESTVAAWQHPRQSTVKQFEVFSGLVDLFNPSQKQRLAVSRAHLALHHPTKPDPSQALTLLRDPRLWVRRPGLVDTKHGDELNGEYLNSFLTLVRAMGLDAVLHLANRGETKEAESLLNMLRVKLKVYLERDNSSRRSPWMMAF